MKKFYKLVSTRADQGGWLIELDGKPVRTPSGVPMLSPSENLAAEIAREWMAQETDILPDTMPLTQLLVTALDRVAKERAVIEDTVLGYLDTDLLCYRASVPPDLVEKEAAVRDPWLDWFEKHYGHRLATTTDLTALRHDEQAHAQVAATVRMLDLWGFTILQLATATTGSLVLALALVNGPADEDDLLRAFYAEEDYKSALYNEEFYGRAPHQEKAMNAAARDLKAARVFLEILGLKKNQD